MQGYRKIHAAKVKAARRKIRRKQARWHGKIIVRGKSGSKQLTANRRKHMTASQMRK